MQRPSYEPFDQQHSSHPPLPYGNPSGSGGGSYAQGQYNQQNFGHQNAPTGFVSRYEVDQSVDSALSMLTNPDILNSLTSMVQQPPPQQQQPQHAYSAPQQHYHHNGAYAPNPGPPGAVYTQRPAAPNMPSYPPAHAMQGPGAMHESRGQMFDGGSGQHGHRAMDAPPPHHMTHGIHPPGAGALASRDSFPYDVRAGQLPQQQRPGQYPPPSLPDNRGRDYRGTEGDSYQSHATPMHSSREQLNPPLNPHAQAHLQGREPVVVGGHDAFGRRGSMDYRQAAPDVRRGGPADSFDGHGGAASAAFRAPAHSAFRAGDYERAPMQGNYNYRETPAHDFRGPNAGRNRDDGRLPSAGGSLLDAYSSQPSRHADAPRFGAPTAPALSSSRSGRGGGESLLDQYGGAGEGSADLHARDMGRGQWVSSRWNDRRSPSPPRRATAALPLRDAKFGLQGKAREPTASAYSSRFERHRSRSPVDRRGRGGTLRSPKDTRGAKGDEEVPPTKELFVGSIRDGTTEAHVHEAFSKFGPIDSLAVKANRHFGFVNFKNLSDAVRAKREMEGKPLATSIKLSIQFTKVDARRGGDDGRPERRIEREPIQREQQGSPASPEHQEQQQEQQQSDAASSSPSEERGVSPAQNAEDEEGQEQESAADEAPAAAGEHAPES